MANISDIRHHIKSIKQTRQITNAMYLVAASRMRKAIRKIEQNRSYFIYALDTMKDIRQHTGDTEHPYLVHRPEGKKIAYIVIAGDKGLAGSYNHDVLNLAEDAMRGKDVSYIYTVGDMATTHFQKTGREVNARFENIVSDPSVNTSRKIVSLITDLYDRGEIDELRVIYMRFVNSMEHRPENFKLLPIELSSFNLEGRQAEDYIDMLYTPSPGEVFDTVVPQFMVGFVYGALVHAYASENSARMAAMENATRSADEMIGKLTFRYNAQRQLEITNEISEIIGASGVFNDKGEK